MTNHEKYKQAFSVIHASDDFSLEVENMKQANKKNRNKTLVASIAACIIVVGSATVAYAADIGGVQRTVQLWIHGDQTQATIEFDGDGTYNVHITDDEGNIHNRGGGGVAFNPDGTERPLTEEELMERITAPDVQYNDDGSVIVYWFDQKIDITDKFQDDICYVKLVNDDEILYMTVKYGNGFATSHNRYIQPSEFN